MKVVRAEKERDVFYFSLNVIHVRFEGQARIIEMQYHFDMDISDKINK